MRFSERRKIGRRTCKHVRNKVALAVGDEEEPFYEVDVMNIKLETGSHRCRIGFNVSRFIFRFWTLQLSLAPMPFFTFQFSRCHF